MMFLPLGYYAFSGIFNCLTTLGLSVFILVQNPKSDTNRRCAVFFLSVAIWSFFYFVWLMSSEREPAEFYMRTCMITVPFMPSLFIHFVDSFLKKQRPSGFYVVNYLLSMIFTLTVYTPLYATEASRHLVFPYWLIPGPVFHLALMHFGIIVGYSVYLLHRALKGAQGIARCQILYVYAGTVVGFVSGSTNYLCWYRVLFPPFLNILVSLFVFLVAYGIVRYRLMDITVAVTRTGILIGVYALVLIVPAVLATVFRPPLTTMLGQRWWLVPQGIFVALALVGPFAYLFFQRKAEARLLREQRLYQLSLQHAARGMTRVRNPNKLAGLIVRVVSRTVRVQHATLLLMDEEHQELVLVASQGPCRLPVASWLLSKDAELMRWIMDNRKVLAVDAIEDPAELPLRRELEFLQASIVVPGFIEDRLVGLLILGRKLSGAGYSSDDLHAFSMLANEAAIALENARSYEALLKANDELRRAHERLIRQERLAAAGQFAAGMAHEIKNPLSAIKTFAEFLPEKYHDHSFRQRFFRIVQSEIDRISTLVRELTDFAKPAPLELHPVKVSRLLGETLDLLSDQSRRQGVEVSIAFRENGSQLKADPNQLKQVFLNILLNSLEAMPAGGTLRVETDSDHSSVRIRIMDSGTGISEEHRKRLFDPFFTTKERGMGLGLAIVKSVMDRHGGQIVVRSEHLRGTTFELAFPVVEPSRATV